MFMLVPVSIFLLRHVDPRVVLIMGLSAFAAANLLGTQATHDWALGDFVTIARLQSIGQAFTLLPIIIIALSNSDPTRATAFAAYLQVVRLGGAEIGIALMAPGCACASRFIPIFSASIWLMAAPMSTGFCSSFRTALWVTMRRPRRRELWARSPRWRSASRMCLPILMASG
jgi:hypothetical protein